MTSHKYGAASSPFSGNFASPKIASVQGKSNKWATAVTGASNFDVDDYPGSFSVHNTVRGQERVLTGLLKKMGFQPRNGHHGIPGS